MKINCRDTNMCVFCKYWLGENAKTDFRTGESTVKDGKGKCSLDSTNQYHKASDLCYQFQKKLTYL